MSSPASRSIPKPLLIFFGVGFLAAIFGGIFAYKHSHWENALQAKLAKLEAQGIATSLREIDRRYHAHGLDPAENAAPIYDRAFAQMSLDDDANIALGDLLELDRPDPENSLIRDVLAANETALVLFKEGSARSYLRYHLDFTEGVDLLVPHIPQLRDGVRLLAGKSIIAAESGNFTEAGDAIVAALGIAIHLREEPGLIPFLTVIAIENIVRSAFERVLSQAELTPETIQTIERNLRQLESCDPLIAGINADLAYGISIYDLIRSDVKIMEEIQESGPKNSTRILFFLFYQITGLMTRDRLGYIEKMAEYIRIAELPVSERAVTPIPVHNFSENPLKAELIQPYIIPSMNRMFQMDLRATAYRRATLIALAAERHRLATGHFFTQLEDLVPVYLDTLPIDPHSPDGAFQWIREETSVSIRSQGMTKIPGGTTVPIEFRLPLR